MTALTVMHTATGALQDLLRGGAVRGPRDTLLASWISWPYFRCLVRDHGRLSANTIRALLDGAWLRPRTPKRRRARNDPVHRDVRVYRDVSSLPAIDHRYGWSSMADELWPLAEPVDRDGVSSRLLVFRQTLLPRRLSRSVGAKS